MNYTRFGSLENLLKFKKAYDEEIEEGIIDYNDKFFNSNNYNTVTAKKNSKTHFSFSHSIPYMFPLNVNRSEY